MFFYQQGVFILATGEAFDTASPADWQWSYDVLGQVKSANRDTAVARNTADNYQYAYDQIGNRISSQKGNSPELSYVANNLNQYTTIGTSVTPTYDADGNQLGGLMPTVALPERGQLTFSYNAHNRPTSVSKNNIILENYTHDHEGRRIQEGSIITIYDGYNAIAEYTVNGVLKTTYAWGLDLSNTLQGAGGVGGLLSVTDYTTQTPLVSYPTYDGNGNVTEYLTEANNGTLAAHYEYDAFGNVINTNNPNNIPIGKQYRYQFSTKPYNRLTGLSYYNYRDYDPVAGRWIGRDSIAEKGGLNLYGFVGNSSINNIDVLGQKGVSGEALNFIYALINGVIGYSMPDCPGKYNPITKEKEKECIECVNGYVAIAATVETVAVVTLSAICVSGTFGWGSVFCLMTAQGQFVRALDELNKDAQNVRESCKCSNSR